MNSRLLPRLSQRCRNSGVLKASIQRHLSPLSTCQPRNRATAHAEQDFTPSGVRPPPVRRDAPALRRSQARAFSDHHLVQLSIDGRDIPFSSLFLRDSCKYALRRVLQSTARPTTDSSTRAIVSSILTTFQANVPLVLTSIAVKSDSRPRQYQRTLL
jgi:hypothetical protein